MSSIPRLTEGVLESIMNEIKIRNPILQVLGTKRVNSGSSGAVQRYRLSISDGKNMLCFAMLATQLNGLMDRGELTDNTIIRVDHYTTSVVNRNEKGVKRVIIILELTVMCPGLQVGHRIGNPISIDYLSDEANNSQPSQRETINLATLFASVAPSTSGISTASPEPTRTSQESQQAIPINYLTPYTSKKWVIQVRIINKSEIRTWNNGRSEGKLFNMDLMDESGEIRAAVFRDMVDKFFDMIQIDKMYYISKCDVKIANKKFSTLKNDYELAFRNDTVVQECTDVAVMPQIHYNFVPIASIADKEPNSVVDVIGICKEATDLQTFTAKSSGRELKKRLLTLLDQSGASITLTLWNKDAELINCANNPVICLKSSRIDTYQGGKNLSVVGGTTMKTNPNFPEEQALRVWFQNVGAEQIFLNLSVQDFSAININTEWLDFEEVKSRCLGTSEKPDYFMLKGTVQLVNFQNAFYKACPLEGCNKKLMDKEDGTFRCEKCNSDSTHFIYQLMLRICIADSTSSHWVTCFNEIAEQLLGQKAEEIGRSVEVIGIEINTILSKLLFQPFIFKLRASFENYADTQRTKMVIMSAENIDHKLYQNYLIKKLTELSGVTLDVTERE